MKTAEQVDQSTSYAQFLATRSQLGGLHGFTPSALSSCLFDFQADLTEWALRKGRAAIFADCGLGKTIIQLAWAQQVVEHTNRPVLILTPLAVGAQTVAEGVKFSIDCRRARDGFGIGQARILVTNYEKLHLFDQNDFAGVVADESSILKHFTGATQKAVTRFLLKMPYRLLCTATAAPNDYIELGTASEALGELGYSDMLSRFFKQDDHKPHRLQEIKNWAADKLARETKDRDSNHFGKLSFRVHQSIGQWRLKGHAVEPFWRWVASWARACRKPSDLGYADGAFILPALIERDYIVIPTTLPDGMLFMPDAVGLREERDERRRTLTERCQLVFDLVAADQSAVVWCHLNIEGDTLTRMIPGARQVKGSDSDDAKEDAYRAFASGAARVLVTKPKIGAWGLNWQHCHHVVTFASHSFEQFYQSVRRCWRFGQTEPVTVDIISTEGERHVRENMKRKADAASLMFTELVKFMRAAERIERVDTRTNPVELPVWL
mgnify:CR=1 FL=1